MGFYTIVLKFISPLYQEKAKSNVKAYLFFMIRIGDFERKFQDKELLLF